MGKYLHKFENLDSFNEAYNGDAPITAITVDVASAFTACNDWESMTVTHDFDGTYIFDREMKDVTINTCDGDSFSWIKVRVYKLGNREVYDTYEGTWPSENRQQIIYFQNITNAGAPGDANLHVSSISRGEKPYHEPWVSYTTGTRKKATGQTPGPESSTANVIATYTGQKDINFTNFGLI